VNFFTHQDQARSNTRKLVFLFLCAVVTLIVITSFLVIAVLLYANTQAEIGLNTEFLTSTIFFQVSLVVIAVVGIGTLVRLGQLRGGGKVVAESLGGRLLNTHTRDLDERNILNVVEEMAIASGTPVPPVYLMEDDAINAFAAGYKPRDAVIGVTRGCIRELSRDELQGVIAHEFSHIFNGDMRLNIRLIGLLYGIMVIGLIGYHILHGTRYRSSGRSGKNGAGTILALGVGLMVVGYGGMFFGNLIKAAVSRQREVLADASAVQFTRNPDGIGGALKKIGGYKKGTVINSSDANEISHMLFCNGIKVHFTGLFATHPPLNERIRRIDPRWDDKLTYSSASAMEMSSEAGVSHLAGSGESALDSVGNPSAAHLSQAVATLEGFSPLLLNEVHSPQGACLTIYCMLVALSNDAVAEKQHAMVQDTLEEGDYLALVQVGKAVAGVPREDYLSLVDLALPSLKQLSKAQYQLFMATLGKLIMADDNISLFEWCLFKILRYNLNERPDRRQRALPINVLVDECVVLMSVLATAGSTDERSAKEAFNRSRNILDLGPLSYQPQLGVNTGLLEKALDKLNHLRPLQKPLLLKAMVSCINADGRVTTAESELLRAVGSLLDCPIPPLLPGQRFI
jgi:Zn-dependent protease with chaperone function